MTKIYIIPHDVTLWQCFYECTTALSLFSDDAHQQAPPVAHTSWAPVCRVPVCNAENQTKQRDCYGRCVWRQTAEAELELTQHVAVGRHTAHITEYNRTNKLMVWAACTASSSDIIVFGRQTKKSRNFNSCAALILQKRFARIRHQPPSFCTWAACLWIDRWGKPSSSRQLRCTTTVFVPGKSDFKQLNKRLLKHHWQRSCRHNYLTRIYKVQSVPICKIIIWQD